MDTDRLYDGTTSVSDAENWLALGSGALLLLVGASRRSVGGALLAASSAPLLYRGITGCAVSLKGAVSGVPATDREGRQRCRFLAYTRAMARQVPAGPAFAKGLTLKMGRSRHAQVHAAVTRANRTRRDRSLVHHHASHQPRGGARDVTHVSRQTRRVHQSRHETWCGDAAPRRTSSRGE